MLIQVIDLEHLGLPGAIASYLIEGTEPALVDTGPSTCLDALREGLDIHGLAVSDLRHLLLTHVHLDHAGAAGHLVRENPDLKVHVREDAVRFMADPTKLVASTRRVFGDAHDELWGDMLPIPEPALSPVPAGGGEAIGGVRAVPTPGHIAHHLAYLHEDEGVLFCGDAMGIVLDPAGPSYPPTPPPAVDVEAWEGTLDLIPTLGATRFACGHFGIHDDVPGRAEELRGTLLRFRDRVQRALAEEDPEDRTRFGAEALEHMSQSSDGDRVRRYFSRFSPFSDWDGMRLYLERLEKKRAEESAEQPPS